jgi:competence protein ComEA
MKFVSVCLLLSAVLLAFGPVSSPAAGREMSAVSGAVVPPVEVKLLDINSATLEQFKELKGIGPVLAQRILDYRQKNGPFAVVDDLIKVAGIGEKKMAALKPLLKVAPPVSPAKP